MRHERNTIENIVHYEVLGRGRPVILIHGWLGSWRYWIPAMQQLSMKYRTYALDLWGFGDSGKDARRYPFDAQVTLLDQFMEKMGIAKAGLVGHDLGAAVVARYAVRYPDRVPRLMAVCPPLFRMAPLLTPLTANPPPPERTLPGNSPTPALVGGQLVNPEADTIPMRSEEMKARVRAALERQVREKQAEEERLRNLLQTSGAAPMSPREAATPPTDRPATEVTAPAPPPVPETLPEVPALPQVSGVPEAKEGEVQRPNPLKEHLQVLDPMALLERHVDAGADQEKLRIEVGKSDKSVVAVSVESLPGWICARSKALHARRRAYGIGDTLVRRQMPR
jgi:pimeloyl-ACP methyl ester carboxylesterase